MSGVIDQFCSREREGSRRLRRHALLKMRQCVIYVFVVKSSQRLMLRVRNSEKSSAEEVEK